MIILLINIMLFSSINQSSLETPQYKLVKKYKKLEIRDYEKMIVAYTNIEEEFRRPVRLFEKGRVALSRRIAEMWRLIVCL